MTNNQSFSNVARRFFRAYRNGSVRVGHSFIRRLVEPCLAQQQEIQLRSGLKLQLDLSKGNQSAIFWHDGDVDVHLYWAIRELVPLGGLFVDCGANCGLMGLLARQYRLASVVFIEPHPRLAKSIRANIQLNQFSSACELVEAAVSDVSGEVTFYEDPQNDGSHSVHSDWGSKMNILGKVQCVTFREIITTKNLRKIHFLKIDTEGNDQNVLNSIGDYLRPDFLEIIYVEMPKDREAICHQLRASGYVGFAVTTKSRREISLMQRDYETGGQPSFFEPLSETLHTGGDVLWCGKGSRTAAYLNHLHLVEPK